MKDGKRRKRRQLSPEEKWELFLEVTSQELSQAGAARKWGVDVSVIIRSRVLARDAALAVFALASRGGRRRWRLSSWKLLRSESDRLSEGLKELAVELTLHRGRQRSAFGRSDRA